MSGFTPILVGAVCAGIAFGGWTFTGKGPNQQVIRSCILLTIICCWLMWAITYMAQLHPIVAPKKSGLRNLDR